MGIWAGMPLHWTMSYIVGLGCSGWMSCLTLLLSACGHWRLLRCLSHLSMWICHTLVADVRSRAIFQCTDASSLLSVARS